MCKCVSFGCLPESYLSMGCAGAILVTVPPLATSGTSLPPCFLAFLPSPSCHSCHSPTLPLAHILSHSPSNIHLIYLSLSGHRRTADGGGFDENDSEAPLMDKMVRAYVCLSVCMRVCLTVSLSLCQCLSICASVTVYLSVCLSVLLSVCASVSICTSVSVYLCVCMCMCLSVRQSVCLCD